jgi:hypothetical protein
MLRWKIVYRPFRKIDEHGWAACVSFAKFALFPQASSRDQISTCLYLGTLSIELRNDVDLFGTPDLFHFR